MRTTQHTSGQDWVRVAVMTIFLSGLVATGSALGGADGGASGFTDDTIRVTIPVPAPDIATTGTQHELRGTGFGYLMIPGMPKVPSRIFGVAIPPGAELVDVSYDVGAGVELPGTYDVVPVPQARALGAEDPQVYAHEKAVYEANHAAVYGSDALYPAAPVELVRKAGYRSYNLVDVRVTPFSYRPVSGRLTYYPEVAVAVHYRLPDGRRPVLSLGSARSERAAEQIVYNHEQAKTWYVPRDPAVRALHDYVIITTDDLMMAVQPLMDWETLKGRTVQVVSTSWISMNYSGYDEAEKIRNFLIDKHHDLAWGIDDVLIVGHYDDVPMRRTQQDTGYGKPETDYYYAELSLPDDDSWDADGDHLYGEDSDPIDFYNEVNVGRIPWSDPEIVTHICEKSVAYEQNDDPAFKKNMLLLGAYYWSDTDNAILMELKIDQPWMEDWTFTRMYEQYSGYYSSYECDYPLNHDNVMAVWPEGQYSFVNWAGHGSPTACYICGMGAPYFISSSDCPSLNDDYPAIIFAAACSNSDTDDLNIGQAMMAQGAVGFLGATKVAYGCFGWDDPYDGATASMDYFFTTCVTSTDYSQGEAHQWALREMYAAGLWDYPKYETFEWGALWGNPNLNMGESPFFIAYPEGLPEYITPGEPTTLSVFVGGMEPAVPGSPTLHYRLEPGFFTLVPLTPLGDNLYEVTIPPCTCDDHLEYYFTAQGEQGSSITDPQYAPFCVYDTTVGEVATIIDDNFETDLGWTVESVDLGAGAWERGVPVAGAEGAPPDDCDGSSRCFLTENGASSSDIDGGPTRLISPLIDLSDAGDPVLHYARWFYNDDLDDDPFDIEVSNDDGATWTLLECVTNLEGGWVELDMHVADYITLTAEMRFRFSAMDNPNDSITEAGVDAFRITDVVCSMAGDGDLNCDGAVNFFDIEPFVLAITDPAGYETAYPDCSLLNGDCNGDGDVDFFDIDAFVELVTGG